MKVYKLEGHKKCAICGEDAGLYIDVLDVTLCRKCGVNLYKELGVHFIPRAVPNVILRGEKLQRPLSSALYEEKDNPPEENSAKKESISAKTHYHKTYFRYRRNK